MKRCQAAICRVEWGPGMNAGVDVITALPRLAPETSPQVGGPGRREWKPSRKKAMGPPPPPPPPRTKVGDKAKRGDHKNLHSISSLLAAQLRHFSLLAARAEAFLALGFSSNPLDKDHDGLHTTTQHAEYSLLLPSSFPLSLTHSPTPTPLQPLTLCSSIDTQC